MLQVGMVVTWDLWALDLQCLLSCIACYDRRQAGTTLCL